MPMPGRILVLDDEENYAQMLQGLLKQHHFLVDMATKPELALEALEERNYELIISDYKMPVMDGAVFLKKARDVHPDLPVILVSGLMNTPELVKVANMGVTLVLEKPIDTTYFIEQVSRWVKPLTGEEERSLEEGGPDAEEADTVFRPAPRTYTYPRDLVYLADTGDLSKRPLQEIWDALERGPHVFLTGPAGAEFELALREITRWKGDGELPNHYFSAGQLRKGTVIDVLKGLPEAKGHSRVVAVGDVSSMSIDDQAFLLTFLRMDPVRLPGGGALTFVFWVENLKALSLDLQAEIRTSLARLSPLNHRLADLAIYTVRSMEAAAKEAGLGKPPVLAGEAVNLWLQFPWKGNWSQLTRVVKKLVRASFPEPVSYAAVAGLLREADEQVVLSPQRLNLEEVMVRKQHEILEKAMERQRLSLRDLLGKLGFDTAGLPADLRPDQVDLLYPEILEAR